MGASYSNFAPRVLEKVKEVFEKAPEDYLVRLGRAFAPILSGLSIFWHDLTATRIGSRTPL